MSYISNKTTTAPIPNLSAIFTLRSKFVSTFPIYLLSFPSSFFCLQSLFHIFHLLVILLHIPIYLHISPLFIPTFSILSAAIGNIFHLPHLSTIFFLLVSNWCPICSQPLSHIPHKSLIVVPHSHFYSVFNLHSQLVGNLFPIGLESLSHIPHKSTIVVPHFPKASNHFSTFLLFSIFVFNNLSGIFSDSHRTSPICFQSFSHIIHLSAILAPHSMFVYNFFFRDCHNFSQIEDWTSICVKAKAQHKNNNCTRKIMEQWAN